MRDILADEGGVMLGSRLKRLAERLQAGAELIGRDCGLPTQPAQMPLLTALWRHGPMSVGEARMALVRFEPLKLIFVRPLPSPTCFPSQ